MTFPWVIACFSGNNFIARPSEMLVFYDIQDVLPVFSAPAVKILLLRVGSQIDKTTLAASQAGKPLFHKLTLFI